MNYFNAETRANNLMLLTVAVSLRDWVSKSKSLKKNEAKYIRMACSLFQKAAESMITRGNTDYRRAILNQAKTSTLLICNEYKGIDGAKYVDTINLIKDDYLDLCDYASRDCCNCAENDFIKCERYNLFMKLGLPVVSEETEDCPFKI